MTQLEKFKRLFAKKVEANQKSVPKLYPFKQNS